MTSLRSIGLNRVGGGSWKSPVEFWVLKIQRVLSFSALLPCPQLAGSAQLLPSQDRTYGQQPSLVLDRASGFVLL